MNHQSFPADEYNAYISLLNIRLGLLRKKKDRISWARLAIVLLIVADIWWLNHISIAFTAVVAVIAVAVFIRLIILAANTGTEIQNINSLISINHQEIAIAGGEYNQLPDGSGFSDPLHLYANDLDIFGKGSVYQYFNRTQSQQGNAVLAAWLLNPASVNIILQRQEAAKELSPQFKWRQQLQAFGMQHTTTIATEAKVKDWIKQEDIFTQNISWAILRWLYPFVALAVLVMYITDIMSTRWFVAAYIAALVIAGVISRFIRPQSGQLAKIVPEIEVLFQSAQWLESNTFHSAYLLQLQQFFVSNEILSSVAIKQLKNILDKFDYNLNLALTIFLNPLFLWDLQMVFELEKWRSQHKTKTLGWFAALGETEAIATIANLQFNHPAWVFPELDSSVHGTLRTMEMGHPLIPENKMVYNNFSIAGTGEIALITGSNMAGKSTFLRSAAVNMVLAMMGAPVCAQQMLLSPMRVISSMRVADNLQESTSTFYAELKKLKAILECVNNQEPVFVLLDEILRGTNSLDRHTGSKALIRQLIRKKAVAMLATHDVELAQLKDDYPSAIHNYYFDAQIAGEELYFDYKLKEGVCKSINASVLMRKIGIEL